MSEAIIRRSGDRILFRMPSGKRYEGVITSVVDGGTYYHVDAMIGDEQVKDGLVFEGEIVEENLPEHLMQIVEMVAITDSTYGVGVGFDDLPLSYVCPFCMESLSRFMVRNGESFPHAPACIVTKARALMQQRKAQPQIEVKIEKPMVCALCGKHYESADSGWCGQQSNEFCSRAHMNQWLMKERGEQHG